MVDFDAMSRRGLLKVAGLTALAAGLPVRDLLAQPTGGGAAAAGPARALRITHMTDLHIQKEKRAQEGVAMCLHHVQEHAKPDFILTGGDLVMDTFATPIERSRTLWDILKSTCKNECGLPIENCLGNHDVFGWHKEKAKSTGEEPFFGKRLALENLGLEKPYRAFKRGGWRFIVLDSVFPDGTGYIGKLDDEQMAWLDGELASDKTTPTLVVSHIPILGMTMAAEDKTNKAAKLPWNLMHADGLAIHKKFVAAGNIRLCLSGHTHMHDRVELGLPGLAHDAPRVTYICDGAVSGAWWGGRKNNCDEGYGVIDLYADGRFEHHYSTYGWKAEG